MGETPPNPDHARKSRTRGCPGHRTRRPSQDGSAAHAAAQGHYLGVSEVNAMVLGVGGAPWKGDHSGSSEAVPTDSCRWGRQEAPPGDQPKAGSPSQEEVRAQGRGIQAPRKGI